ncbi:hypothetical protein EZS27_041590, partial [termite gut metagenome]
ARGLRSIVETIMIDIMFDMPSQEQNNYEVTLEYTKQQLNKANIAGLQSA